MNLLQNNVLGVNKLNCFKAMQVLGGPTHILIWGASEIAKSPTRYIKWGTWSFDIKGDLNLGVGPKILVGSLNPNDAMTIAVGDGGPKNVQSKIGML